MGRTKGSKNKVKEAKPEDTTNLKTPKPRGRPALVQNNMVTAAGLRHYEKNTKHQYTELGRTAISNTELYNLYGVVVDASMPHINKKDGKWQSFVRIIDPSMQNQENKSIQSLSVRFTGANIESLPTFKKMGEIIRIHRCNIGSFKGLKYFNVIMTYGSSWVIFEGMPQKKEKLAMKKSEGSLN